ncbi:MAG: hypothetical protein ACI8ZO_000924 [Flavobacteriales bacterium]|jgi:hypothetical protein
MSILHSELVNFRKIPRNDILLFLYENGGNSNISELNERLNQTNQILYIILTDLLEKELIKADNILQLRTKQGSYLEDKFTAFQVLLTEKGKDYTECVLIGSNPDKYQNGDPIEYMKFIKPNGSVSFRGYFNKSFDDFYKSGLARQLGMDKYHLFYILTGKRHKTDENKKVFISYAHDLQGESSKWVSKLANQLAKYFKVEYDDNLIHKMNPYDYMRNGIQSSDYVIIVFNKNYKFKYENISNSGVKFEFSIIEDQLFKKIGRAQYLSILTDGDKKISIPQIMQETLYFDFRNEMNFENELKNLIDEIKN